MSDNDVVQVRCVMCGEVATVDRADENRWYETHKCAPPPEADE